MASPHALFAASGIRSPHSLDRGPCVSKAAGRLRLMPLGGSITLGVGSEDRNGYREMLLSLLTTNDYDVQMVGTRNTGSMAQSNHEGWRGCRIDEIDKKARRSVGKLQPNVFAINAGSNDCLQDFELRCAGDRMSGLLDYLWATAPSSTMILSTLVVNRDSEVDSRVRYLNEVYRKLVNEKAAEGKRIVLADMCPPEGPGYEDIGSDGTHPGSAGYAKMSKIWYKAVEEAAGKGFFSLM